MCSYLRREQHQKLGFSIAMVFQEQMKGLHFLYGLASVSVIIFPTIRYVCTRATLPSYTHVASASRSPKWARSQFMGFRELSFFSRLCSERSHPVSPSYIYQNRAGNWLRYVQLLLLYTSG